MYTLQHDELVVERSRSARTLCLIGGVILTLSGAALLAFTRFIWTTTQQSKPPLVLGSLLFVFAIVAGIAMIAQSGANRLTLRRLTGEYTEETSRFGKKSARTGPMSDFSALELTPCKDKDAGCVINLYRRCRPLFPIQLETYDGSDYSQARADLQRISEATGIPADGVTQIPATQPRF